MLEYLTKVKNVLLTADVKENLDVMNTNFEKRSPFPSSFTTAIQSSYTNETKVTNNLYTDVELITATRVDADKKGPVFSTVLDSMKSYYATEGGIKLLSNIISHPSFDKELLHKRQEHLIAVSTKTSIKNDELFAIIKKHEHDIFWFFDDLDTNLLELYQSVYFRFFMFRPCNSNPVALTSMNLYKILMSPTIGIISPIMYFVLPYLILTWKFQIKIPFTQYIRFMISTLINGNMTDIFLGGKPSLTSKTFKWVSFAFSLLFYFQGMFNSIEISKTAYKISKYLSTKANAIINTINAATDLISNLWNDEFAPYYINTNTASNEMFSDLQDNLPIASNFTIFSNFGEKLKFLKTISKETVQGIMIRVYILDYIYGTCNVMKYRRTCYAQYQDSTQPIMDLTDQYHPCLNYASVIANSIKLNGNNMILTGPNAGGKSTFIKSLLINVILAQTMGICFATSAVLSPFSLLHSQMNVPDTKGKESLFEAEMYRCKSTLDLSVEDGLKLIVMDEIFNSTNPVEGISGAYAIAKTLATNKSVLLMFTTHFTYLTKLAKRLPDRFVNYKMNVQIEANNTIVFPYKLQRGVSKQYIALQLLKMNGFDSSILEEAESIRKRLIK